MMRMRSTHLREETDVGPMGWVFSFFETNGHQFPALSVGVPLDFIRYVA